MSRRVRRVGFQLDAQGISRLPLEEIKAVLRAADDLIMCGGRSLLAKILKGSRNQDVLGKNLDQNPSYGFYHDLSIEEITKRIDWTILKGYLRIEYDYRLPMLVFTPLGWSIEKETYAEELLLGIDVLLETSPGGYDVSQLKDRNREIILLLLDKIAATGDRKYVPLLEAWEQIDYKKVRQRIRGVIGRVQDTYDRGRHAQA